MIDLWIADVVSKGRPSTLGSLLGYILGLCVSAPGGAIYIAFRPRWFITALIASSEGKYYRHESHRDYLLVPRFLNCTSIAFIALFRIGARVFHDCER